MNLIELVNPQPKNIVGRYVKAYDRWVAAGRPLRSKAEIREIFEEKCKPCPEYVKLTKSTGRCRLCSCQLNLWRGINKIAWATEGCPKNPPEWKASV